MRGDFDADVLVEMARRRGDATDPPKQMFMTAEVSFSRGAGTFYLSDRALPTVTPVHLPIVRKDGWGEIANLAQRDATTLDVPTMEIQYVNRPINGIRLSDYIRLEPEGVDVVVYYNFIKPDGDHIRAVAFAGITQAHPRAGRPMTWNEAIGTLFIVSRHQKYLDRPWTIAIDAFRYPFADPSAINRVIPVLLGDVTRAPGATIERIPIDLDGANGRPEQPEISDYGYSKVLFCERPFFMPSYTCAAVAVQWNGTPIRNGFIGSSLSDDIDPYVDLLLKERAELSEFILTSKLASYHVPIKHVRIPYDGTPDSYDEIIQPVRIPADITNPTFRNINLGVTHDADPVPLAVRLSDRLEAYGNFGADFYGDNFDQSLGDYGWPSGDIWRRNLTPDDTIVGGPSSNPSSAPISSQDTPVEAGRTYHVKLDAMNVNFTGGGSGVYYVPIFPSDPTSTHGQNAGNIIDAEAHGSRGGPSTPLGGTIYMNMAIRGGGGASVYLNDVSPLAAQSGTFIGILRLTGNEGIVARSVSLRLSRGTADAKATIELVSLNVGPTIGQTIFSLDIGDPDFDAPENVMLTSYMLRSTGAGFVPSNGAVLTGGFARGILTQPEYYLVKKYVPLSLIPPGEYGVRFSGSTFQTATSNPYDPLSGTTTESRPIGLVGGRSSGGSEDQVAISQTSNVNWFNRPAMRSPGGEEIVGHIRIDGARFADVSSPSQPGNTWWDGYSVIEDAYGLDLGERGLPRHTCWVQFYDAAIPDGVQVSANLVSSFSPSPKRAVQATLQTARVPEELIGDSLDPLLPVDSQIEFNGLIDTLVTYKQAILKMCFEGHLAFDWSVEKAEVRQLYSLIATTDDPDFTITVEDLLKNGRLKALEFSRSDASKVANYIIMKYRKDWSQVGVPVDIFGQPRPVPLFIKSIYPYRSIIELKDENSIARNGRLERPELFKFDFIADDTSANELGTYLISYYGHPHDVVEVVLATSALGVETDDRVAVNGV